MKMGKIFDAEAESQVKTDRSETPREIKIADVMTEITTPLPRFLSGLPIISINEMPEIVEGALEEDK